jgi:N-acetyl-1-D-myo-inositol-2-amino-2-deoxy-alpha-D-glucopyranoside deacetylase
VIFAHPDDESFLAAGTMARLVDLGAQVVTVSATRGEEGEIAEVADATRENLGEVRERELREAMAAIGVDDIRFLGYRDSGMAGSATNAHPDAFAQAAVEEVGARIRSLIDAVRPAVLITFGPEGIYLHPDHVRIHQAVMESIAQAERSPDAHRVGHLFFAAMPREVFLEIWNRPGSLFAETPYEELIRMGTPRAEITHAVAIGNVLERKMAALRSHHTQFGDRDPLEEIEEEVGEELRRFELYRRCPLPWAGSGEPGPPFIPYAPESPH